MSVFNVLNNPGFVAKALVDMIANEEGRIITSGLAPEKDAKSAIRCVAGDILKLAEKKRNWKPVLQILSHLHDTLSSIKLPGDFEKLGSDPLLVDLVNLPIFTEEEYEEKFENLSGIIDKLKGLQVAMEPKEVSEDEHYKEEAHIDSLRKEQEHHEGPHEDFVDDNTKSAQIIASVGVQLEKIAYDLGRDGHHDAAYLVERTVRNITQGK